MKLEVRCEIFFLFITFFITFCFSIIPSFAQYPPDYSMYGLPYGAYSGYSGYPNYGYSRPQYYGGYSYNPPYYGIPYGGYQYGGYYPNSGYPQPTYYGTYTSGLSLYDPFDWRAVTLNGQSFLSPALSSYNQPNYGIPYGGYQYWGSNNYAPQTYYDSYGQYYQNPLQTLYKDADEELDDDNDGDDITLKEGETLSIILRSNQSKGALPIGPDVLDKGEWILDTDKLDSDIIKKISDKYFPVPEGSNIEGVKLSIYSFDGREQWLFEAKSPGTTIIELNYKAVDYLGREGIQDTFKIEVTVVED